MGWRSWRRVGLNRQPFSLGCSWTTRVEAMYGPKAKETLGSASWSHCVPFLCPLFHPAPFSSQGLWCCGPISQLPVSTPASIANSRSLIPEFLDPFPGLQPQQPSHPGPLPTPSATLECQTLHRYFFQLILESSLYWPLCVNEQLRFYLHTLLVKSLFLRSASQL